MAEINATRAQQFVEIQNAFAQIADGLESDLKKLPHVPRHGPSAARYERSQVVADAKYRAGRLILGAFQLGAFVAVRKAPSVIAVLEPSGSGPRSVNSFFPALVDAMRRFLVETGHQVLAITTQPDDGWDCVLTIRAFADLMAEERIAEADRQRDMSEAEAVADDAPQWDKETEARNKWLYEQCRKGKKYAAIIADLKNKPKSWARLEYPNSIKKAAEAYATRKQLQPIPHRSAGRPKQK